MPARGMISFGVVCHGGVGSAESLNDGCQRACTMAFSMLKNGAAALDAAVAAVRVMEDDGRFNAGSGSSLRLDGKTVEMDASIMDSRGRLGTVIAVRDVKNPVVLARAIADTPHVALTGEGASLFARRRGLPAFLHSSPAARSRFEEFRRRVKDGKNPADDARWNTLDMRSLWNFTTAYEDVFPSDTVGVVVKDRSGYMAAACSTGGATPMLLGRVGDTAVAGSGFFAGPRGAFAATGIGEEIIRKVLAKSVYDFVACGQDLDAACRKGIDMFPAAVPVGLIAIGDAGYTVEANRPMASCAMVEEA